MNSIPPIPTPDFEERLRFEMLLTEVSARFVSGTPELIDEEIVNAQRQIAQVLALDRSTLAQLQEPDRFVVTHCWALPSVGPFPGFAGKDLPWLTSVVTGSGERQGGFSDPTALAQGIPGVLVRRREPRMAQKAFSSVKRLKEV